MNKLVMEIPIKTVSEANCSQDWRTKASRHRRQKDIVRMCLQARIRDVKLPCHVKLIRLAPKSLDTFENLPCSLKYIADAVCELLIPGLASGRADGDPRITLSCAQEKSKHFAVRIEIECT